jgi:predicted RNase H-like HicB family nuclease
VTPSDRKPEHQTGPYNRVVTFDDYKVVLYRQADGSWVAEIPAVGGCYALMDTRAAALAELELVFAMIAQEHEERGVGLPKDTTEIVHA